MSSCAGNCGSCASKGGCAEKPEPILKSVKKAVLVLSGKGGVGKSTVAASLAVTLAKQGKKVGLLDVDFHGPSQPTLFNVSHLRLSGTADNKLIPLEAGRVKLVSIGLLLENSDDAIIWRGPVKMGVIKQLLEEVEWGELDYLVLDFPPGTGDESLSACQLIDCPKCAVLVTTPQEVALADCRKCLDFCNKVEVPVAGIVENMSGFVCPDCGHRHELFSSGGGERLAAAFGVKLLAQLPFEPVFLQQCDNGNLADGLANSTIISSAMEQVATAVL